jgi:hypothetical protein
MENKEEVPWTWADGGKPSQPNIHPIDSHAVGTRFLTCGYDAEMKPFGVGDWVRYTDYARIKEDLEKSDGVVFKQAVENERLKEEVQRLTAFTTRTIIPNEELANENARLKAEVERLTKAGDAMADEIISCYRAEGYDPADSETIPKWNAAKEGKQP